MRRKPETELDTRDLLIRIGLPSLPIITALIILWLLSQSFQELAGVSVPGLEPVRADSVQALQTELDEHDYHWPPAEQVPALLVPSFPSGMNEIRSQDRKSLFFRSLLPLVLLENERILAKRAVVKQLHQRLNANADAELTPEESELLDQVWSRYRIEGDIRDADSRERLLRRLDVVPPSLALAQAANESGWGTSRFTREANNLFGEWTWDESQGLMPQQRAEGATHFVRRFPDLHSSVRSYIHNLNIGHAYSGLRQLRANIRDRGRTPDGLTLAQGLERYSERGQEYIREIQSMIRQNELHELPANLRLVEPGSNTSQNSPNADRESTGN